MLLTALAGYAIASLHLTPAKSAGVIRFVVAGDDRVEMSVKGEDRPTDNYDAGFNEGVLGPLWDAIFKEPGLNFVVFTGDLVSGETSPNAPANRQVKSKLEGQLKAWTEFLMKHQPTQIIPVFPVRGNHETIVQNRNRADANEAWAAFFKDLMVQEKVENPPTDPFNYAIRSYPNVLMLGLDTFKDKQEYTVDNAWVKQQLQDNAPKHVFPFLHSMCFYAGNHKDYVGGKPPVVTEADAKKNRNEFMELLRGVNCQYLFAGHDHFLSVVDATKPDWGKYSIRQVVGGTAGAPFVKVKEIPAMEDGYTLSNPVALNKTYGYVLVEVDGDKVTVTFKALEADGGYAQRIDLTKRTG